jgi:hypothetical protein
MEFLQLITQLNQLNLDYDVEWDVGVEVCFYRDYLWHKGEPVRGSRFSPKRTFDLCLFSQHSIVIIEAKVYQTFESEQNDTFAEDPEKIRLLLGDDSLQVHMIALASSKYFEADAKYGNGEGLRPFNGRLSWADVYRLYPDPLLLQANDLYGSRMHKLASR